MAVVRLNVGGELFTTLASTLQVVEQSTLAHIIKYHKPAEDPIFLDRDPELFRLVLRWLRNPFCSLMATHMWKYYADDAFQSEIRYLGLQEAIFGQQSRYKLVVAQWAETALELRMLESTKWYTVNTICKRISTQTHIGALFQGTTLYLIMYNSLYAITTTKHERLQILPFYFVFYSTVLATPTHLFIIAGTNESSDNTFKSKRLAWYNIAHNTWEELPDAPDHLCRPAVVVYHHSLFIVMAKYTHCLSLETKTWTTWPSNVPCTQVTQLVVWQDQVWALFKGNHLYTVELATGVWKDQHVFYLESFVELFVVAEIFLAYGTTLHEYIPARKVWQAFPIAPSLQCANKYPQTQEPGTITAITMFPVL